MTSALNEQQKIAFEKYQSSLKDKVHSHEQLKQMFHNVATSLS